LFSDIHAHLIAELPELGVDELQDYPDSRDGVERVIVASPTIDEASIAALVALCRRRRIKLSVVPPARGMFGTAVQLTHVADLPVVEYNTWDISRSTLLLKRMLDIAVSLTALVVLAPLFALIAVAIVVDSGKPVIFAQTRAGLERRPFRMLKFRTMVTDAEDLLSALVPFDKLREPVFKLQADPRVTRVGRLLRRTSLDELPQLINVLRGEMSLVGPRPEQVELVDRYEPAHMFRLAVKPGLTGPMQIYGRGRLTFEERLAVEREYVENLSVGRDIRILALTVAPVVRGTGAF
jgi:exopolysaccharide biosynthesis polyprenyl glycosylphosphotransferase